MSHPRSVLRSRSVWLGSGHRPEVAAAAQPHSAQQGIRGLKRSGTNKDDLTNESISYTVPYIFIPFQAFFLTFSERTNVSFHTCGIEKILYVHWIFDKDMEDLLRFRFCYQILNIYVSIRKIISQDVFKLVQKYEYFTRILASN